jgi:hypothetical protein
MEEWSCAVTEGNSYDQEFSAQGRIEKQGGLAEQAQMHLDKTSQNYLLN